MATGGKHQTNERDKAGDPLSPYLLIICAETLSSLIHNVERSGLISGVPTSKKGPCLSHLFFVVDCLLFCKENDVEWCRLMKLLEQCEKASGQKLNKEKKKKSIFFSRNTSLEHQ